MPTEMMQQPFHSDQQKKKNKKVNENAILDLAQTSLREDSLSRIAMSGKTALHAMMAWGGQHTFVLILVIFLMAQPSPVRRCFAATTQP
jgi:hypothetical protein